MRRGKLLAAALLLGVAPAFAQPPPVPLPAPQASPSAAPTPAEPNQIIADTQESGSDERIAARIRGIFSELPAFADVEVGVTQGVVSLSGTVPDPDDIARAEGIAGRVAGVVTVENALERDVSVAADVGGIASLHELWEDFIRLLPLLGTALAAGLLIALAGHALARLTGAWRRAASNSFIAELLASAIRFVFVIAGLVVALKILGATALLGAVLGGAGVIGIALGFAMRDTIQNYIASLLLSLRQPFRANDHVVIDTLEGRVIRLTSRATILMTLDGNHMRIPNSKVFNGVILNYSRNPTRRFEFDLALDASADALAARDAGRKALMGLDFVLADPAPEASIEAVGEPSGTARFHGWIDQRATDWGKARSQAMVAVKRALDERGLALAAPVQRVRLERASESAPEEGNRQTHPARATEDTRPSREISAMVEAERASAPAQDRDLLDRKRPVE